MTFKVPSSADHSVSLWFRIQIIRLQFLHKTDDCSKKGRAWRNFPWKDSQGCYSSQPSSRRNLPHAQECLYSRKWTSLDFPESAWFGWIKGAKETARIFFVSQAEGPVRVILVNWSKTRRLLSIVGTTVRFLNKKKNEQMTFLPGQVKSLEAATVKGDKEKQWWFFWKKKKWELLAGLAPSNFTYCNRAWAMVIWVTLLAQIFLQAGPEQLCLTSEKTPESPRTLTPEKVIRSNLLHWPTAQPLTGKKPCTLLLSSSPTEVKGQALNPLFIKKNPLTLVKRHILHALSQASQSAKCVFCH